MQLLEFSIFQSHVVLLLIYIVLGLLLDYNMVFCCHCFISMSCHQCLHICLPSVSVSVVVRFPCLVKFSHLQFWSLCLFLLFFILTCLSVGLSECVTSHFILIVCFMRAMFSFASPVSSVKFYSSECVFCAVFPSCVHSAVSPLVYISLCSISVCSHMVLVASIRLFCQSVLTQLSYFTCFLFASPFFGNSALTFISKFF